MSERVFDEIVSLHIYPIKSMGAMDVQSLELTELGPLWDRQWVVVDEGGQFLSQRQFPRLARLRPRIDKESLRLRISELDFEIPLQPSGDRLPIRVWKSEMIANRVQGSDLHEALSEFLGKPCFLVQYGDETRREVTKGGKPRGVQFRFADSSSLLVTTHSSLADLNRRLHEPVPMSRFRANVVLRGSEPWMEDQWERLVAGDVELEMIANCGRCLVINKDQETGESASSEPLSVLSQFRRHGGSVDFGRLAVHRGVGSLQVGQKVELKGLSGNSLRVE